MKYPKKKDQMKYIGSVCTFEKVLYASYFKNNLRKWLKTSGTKRTGKIVGFGCTYNGKYIPENKGFFDENVGEGPCFKARKRVVHVKVRTTGEEKSWKIAPVDCKIMKEK